MRVGFLNAAKAYAPLRSAFCGEVASDGAFETYADMGALPWPEQNGGQPAAAGTDARTGAQIVSGLHEGGPVTVLGGEERAMIVYNQGWDIVIGIYHDAINDNRVGSLERWALRAGERFEQHKDYLAISALNSGDGTTYGKCYDGLSFFNDSHVDPKATYTTTQDNLGASTLSLDNFETVRIAASKFLDSKGKPVGILHDLLIVPTDLERIGNNITDNSEDYATANRARNPYAGKVSLLVVPGGWMDSTAWVLASARGTEKPVYLQMREAPRLVMWDDESQGSGVRYYKWYGRYVPFYGDWRLAYMGNT